ncbi:MAG: HYR domain-containing protein [Thermoanaerobaculia bacterium]
MQRKIAVPLLLALGLVLALSASAWAETESITVNLTSPQTTYTPGQDNTFTFNVDYTTPDVEWADRLEFVFPAALAFVSATPASGTGACGSNAGIQSACWPSVSWNKTGVPCSGAFVATGCGVYTGGTYAFDVTVNVPAGFTGPLPVTLNSSGDGFGSPPNTDTDTVTFAQGGGCTLTLTCPGDQTATAPPGGSGTVVDFPAPTTGGTCKGATVDCVPASGDFFLVGTTNVACTATATGGTPTATCNFAVTVGNQPPQEIPAASTFGLAALGLLLAGAAFVTLRRLG